MNTSMNKRSRMAAAPTAAPWMRSVRFYAQAGGLSPVIHGAGIFYRGATHVLAALTLGGPGDAQLVDTIEYQETKKTFMLHYNFPPFSVGETGRVGGMNRRMIGHGALAEKALRAVLPTKDDFPYTIRIVAESLASNGSTSMASRLRGNDRAHGCGRPDQRAGRRYRDGHDV